MLIQQQLTTSTVDRDQTLIEIQIHNPFRSRNLILIFHILMVQMPWIGFSLMIDSLIIIIFLI